MPLTDGTHPIGPDTGHLYLRTTRQGMAAKVGHDLLIALQRWSGQITVDGADLTSAKVTVEVEMGSLEVLEGTGGAMALSGDDSKDITATARKLLDVEGHPRATFTSSAITVNSGSSGGGTIAGTLTLLGRSNPLTVEVSETGPTAWRGTASLLQTDFGITPYRAFFGALKLADPVSIEVTVELPAP